MSIDEKKRGRPEKDNKKVLIPVRVEPEMIDKLDTLTDQLSKQTGFNLSRADIIRKALSDYIDKNISI